MTRPKTVRTAAAVVLVLLATPGAAQSPQEWDRTQLVPDIEFADGRGGMQAGIRCGTRPIDAAEAERVEQLVRAHGGGDAQRKLNIPVAFHVVRTAGGDRFNVTDEQVQRSLDVLNASYRTKGYSFTLSRVIRHNNTKFARKCHGKAPERSFKRRHAIDPATTLNVYSCRPGQGILGYAWLPHSWPEDHFMHGVVINYASVPGGAALPYDEGDTLVHEVGHYLGLWHTFDGKGCREPGDFVADTPAERRAAYGCPLERDTCRNDPGLDPVENFMNYSDDACMIEFTPGQKRRMNDQVATFKPTLWASS